MRVLLTLATRPVDLLAEDIDLVITMGPLPDSELISCRICSIPLRFCTSPRYLEPRSPLNHVSNLANHRILNHYDGRQALPCRDAECNVPDFMFVPHLVAREPAVLLSFALGGAGITLLPAVYVRDAVTRADLVRVLPELDFGTVDVHICFA